MIYIILAYEEMPVLEGYHSFHAYEPSAAGLAAELRNAFLVEPRLIPGSNGIFDVLVDGKLVFSKHETGRFPEPGEVIQKLKT